MLLTISLKTRPARDLGYLLRKHPERVQSFQLSFGSAHVFYPAANDELCTAALLLDVDPVGLVRGKAASTEGGLVDTYVNDRAYAASSFMSVAVAKVFGSALAGRSEPPELADRAAEFEATIVPVRSSNPDLAQRLFEPLGYSVDCTSLTSQQVTPAISYQQVSISAGTTLQRLLNHVYVLIPVLDGEKHYWVGDEEVEKLFRFGKDWLSGHPERELITKRYLRRAPSLARAAVARLSELDGSPESDSLAPDALRREEALEKPLRLQARRVVTVVGTLRAVAAKSVIDVGCGEGDLIEALARDGSIDRILGVDVSVRQIERTKARIDRVPMPISRRERIELFQSSVLYADERLNGTDAMTLLEVIEHIEPERLEALERVIFGELRPRNVVVTTPNREYNRLFGALAAGSMRHPDHRFEWSRGEFSAWADGIASRHDYSVSFEGIGDADATCGYPTQMCVFRWL